MNSTDVTRDKNTGNYIIKINFRWENEVTEAYFSLEAAGDSNEFRGKMEDCSCAATAVV